MNIRRPVIVAVLCVLIAAAQASSCPSCYGEAQGPVIDGMNKAIMAMIGITGFVLSGFVALFISIGRRVKQHEADAMAAASNTEQGAL